MIKKDISKIYISFAILIMTLSSAGAAQTVNVNRGESIVASSFINVALLQPSQSTYGQTTSIPTPPGGEREKSPFKICIERLHSLREFHEIEKKLLFRSNNYDTRKVYAHKFDNQSYFTRKDIKRVRAYNRAELKCFNDNINSIPGGYDDEDIKNFKSAYASILQLPTQELKKIRRKVTIGEYNDLMHRIRLTWGYLYVTIRGTKKETEDRRSSAIGKFLLNNVSAKSRVEAWKQRKK